MTARQIEDRIRELEGVRVVIRANKNTPCGDYDYVNCASDNWRVSEFLSGRVRPAVGQHDVDVVRGDGKTASGNMLMRTLRDSY